ncbi:Venom carboxylesterase-6 [Blattella germanica]|nr:Venom carboxylesterase-6 [Blattella germanica]
MIDNLIEVSAFLRRNGATMLFVAILSIIVFAVADDDIIELKQGLLRGHRLTSRKGRDIFAYQGIPYAQPPIGELRFKPPHQPKPWKGVRDATKDGSVCPQRNFYNPDEELQGSEDCLYLNKPNTANNELLDVMFWIHGGGWVAGSGGSEDFGPQYLLDKNVVLVSFNYRLGALGFLSTGDKQCPGNNGLKDHVAALRWVRDNIAAFGGNPNSVTVFGESAGGASVQYLMISPASQGLFHRGISQSGTALVIWASAPNGSTIHHTRKLATLLDCPVDNNNKLLSCLRSKDAKEIASKDKEFMEWDSDPLMPFNVVVETEVEEGDEPFLTMSPRDALHAIQSNKLVPWMVGLNSGEGAVDAARILRNNSLAQDLDQRFDELIPMMFFIRETAAPSTVKNISQQIRKFYFQDRPINNESASGIVDMSTDAHILFGTDEAVKRQAEKSPPPVYYYYFDYRGTNSRSSLYGDFNNDYGVSHEDELQYLFPQDHYFPNSTKSREDDNMIDILTTLWTNFAHTGNPTPKQSSLQTWHPVSSPDLLEYAHIQSNGLKMEQNLLKPRVDFWTSLNIRSGISATPKQEL